MKNPSSPLPSMPQVHDRVLQLLLQWQAETEDKNRFFYLKRRTDARFQKGYWFPGNEDFMLISFWSGSDNQNKTSNAFLEISRSKGCRAFLSARDSNVKYEFFQQSTSGPLSGYRSGPRPGQFSKLLSKEFVEYETCLKQFLATDKPTLDRLIQESSEPIGEEFESPLSFITLPEFERTLSAVQLQRRRRRINALLSVDLGPIRLSQVVIRDYQGIEHAELQKLPADASWIFLTGENAMGKTVFLRALALALSGQRVYERYKIDKSWLSASIWFEGEERTIIRTELSSGGQKSSAPNNQLDNLDDYLVAYGPSRLATLPPDAQNKAQDLETNLDSLFEPTGVSLRNFDYELAQASVYDEEKFRFLKEAIVTMTDGRIHDISVVAKKGRGEVQYHEAYDGETDLTAASQLTASKITTYYQLATGLRSLINLAADIYLRLSEAQGRRLPKELTGIVIIDELENHLHPKLQKALPQALSKVFPQLQFIASTHSPIPFLGAPKETAFIKISRNQEHRIMSELIRIDISNLLPNSILSSPIFGFEDIIPVSHRYGEAIRVEDTYQEVAANDAVRTQLAQVLTKESTDQLLQLLNKAQRSE